jgi:hypothetical protein
MKKAIKKVKKKNTSPAAKTKDIALDVKSKIKPREEWLHSKPTKGIASEPDLHSKQKGREIDLD